MRYLLLATAIFLLATSCADDDLQPRRNETDLEALDRLVPVTQTGANTFGCLINGETWYNRGGSFNDPDLKAVYAETLSGPYFNILSYALDPFLASERDRLSISVGDPRVGAVQTNKSWDRPIWLTSDDYIFYYMDTLSPVGLTLTRFDLQN